MDPAGGPDAKKARWSPNTSPSDVFANYGYGPQASISQNSFNGSSSPSAPFASSPLYSTPTLSSSTNINGNGMPSQLSPNAAAAFAQQQQQQQAQANANGNGYAGLGAYNMLGMGLPAMSMLGGFPYNGQMTNFPHVSICNSAFRTY